MLWGRHLNGCRPHNVNDNRVRTMSDDSTKDVDEDFGSSVCYVSFDDWYQEIEGSALRAERLKGPVDELRAAFEAGRQGTGITDTCHKCGSVSGVYLQLCDDCMTQFNNLDA